MADVQTQRRLFTCPTCFASVLANAPPVDDDDEGQWPVCQGTLKIAEGVMATHKEHRMIPDGEL